MPSEFEPTAGSDECDPWEWLAAAVSADGEGYKLLSPAGGVMVISNEQRERMVACVNFLAGVPTDQIAGKHIGDILNHQSNIDCSYCGLSRELERMCGDQA